MQVIADGRHSVPTNDDDRLGQPGAQRDAAADRRRHGARRGDHGAGHLPRPERLPLRGDLHRDPAGVRGELLLGGPAGAAAGHRRDRHPRRARQPDTGHPPRQLRVQPLDDRRPADRRLRRGPDPAGAQRRREPAGPLRARCQGHHAERRAPHRADGGRPQRAVRQRSRRRARAGTSTSSPWTRRPAAGPDPTPSRPRRAPRSSRPPNPARPPRCRRRRSTSTATVPT